MEKKHAVEKVAEYCYFEAPLQVKLVCKKKKLNYLALLLKCLHLRSYLSIDIVNIWWDT